MASGTFDAFENKNRGFWLRGLSVTQPTTVYVTPLNAAPTGGETGTQIEDLEPSDPTFQRFPMPCNSSYWTAASATDGVSTNNVDIFWAGLDWDGFEANHWAIMDSATGGSGMWFGEIDDVREYGDGDTLTIPAGSLSTQFGGVTV